MRLHRSVFHILAVGVLALLLGVGPAAGQYKGTYFITRQVSLSTSAEVITVRLAADARTRVALEAVSVHSSATLEFTVERDGSFASGSTLTPTERNPQADNAVTAAATHTTSISGTTVLTRHEVAADATYLVYMRGLELWAGEEFTIRTESSTADVIINIEWHEK